MKRIALEDNTLRLGLFYPNTPSIHVTSRVVADTNPDSMSLATHKRIAAVSEEIGLDYVFIADRWAPYGPESTAAHHQDPMLAAFILGATLIGLTERIGIITTLHTTYFHPAHLARIGANLDTLSGGRWGWNIVTGVTADEMEMFGHQGGVAHDLRYDMAREMLALIKKIWGGMRRENAYVDWQGTHYTMRGAVVGPDPVQAPHPLLVNAGASDAGRRFAAEHCDYIFLTDSSQEGILRRMQSAREQAVAFGRPEDAVRLMMAARVIVRDTQDEADQMRRWIADNVDLPAARNFVAALMGGVESIREAFGDKDEAELLRMWGGAVGEHEAYCCGPPEKIAQSIINLHREVGCQGLLLTFPLWHEDEIRRFGKQVMPLLAEAGVWTHPGQRGWNW